MDKFLKRSVECLVHTQRPPPMRVYPFRLPRDLIERVDAYLQVMRQTQPGLHRADAVRFLLLKSLFTAPTQSTRAVKQITTDPRVPPHVLRQIAGEASVEVATVCRVIQDRPVRSRNKTRVLATLRARGLFNLIPAEGLYKDKAKLGDE